MTGSVFYTSTGCRGIKMYEKTTAFIARDLIPILTVCGIFIIGAGLYFATAFNLLIPVAGALIFCFLCILTILFKETILLGFIAVAILLPPDLSFQYQNFPRIGPTRILLVALLTGWFIRFGVDYRLKSIRCAEFPLLLGIGSFLAASTISAVLSVAPLVTFYAVIGRELLEQYMLFYIFYHYFLKEANWSSFSKSLFWTTTAVCVFALYELVFLTNPLLPYITDAQLEFRGGFLRIRSTFFHPIALGCYLNLVFPLVVADLACSGRGLRRIFLIFLLCAILVTSFFTLSRGPWICLLLEIVMMVLWFCRRKMTTIVIVLSWGIALIFSILIIYNISGGFAQKVSSLLNPNQIDLSKIDETSSEFYRIQLVRSALTKMEGGRWIYGYGPNAFFLSDVRAEYSDHVIVLDSPDNNYIRLLLENGFLGIASFFMLLTMLLIKIIDTIRNSSGKGKLLSFACLTSLLGFIIANTSVSMFNMFPLGTLFWIIGALGLQAQQSVNNK
jgi:O-antigen ligase